MKLNELLQIQKLYFGHEELARALGITLASARVAASRYARQGLLLRVKKNVYVLRERWNSAGLEEKFQLANIAQVPSYISLATALEHYGLTTQAQRDFVESVALKRTTQIRVQQTLFRYTKIAGQLYLGFHRKNGYFIATPEKALLDAVYLTSLGRYALDFSALEPDRLDHELLATMSEQFPARTGRLLQSHGYLSRT